MPQGAAGSSAAAVQALHALVAILLSTLSRRSFPQGIPKGVLTAGNTVDSTAFHADSETSSLNAMQALRQLDAKVRGADVGQVAGSPNGHIRPAGAPNMLCC